MPKNPLPLKARHLRLVPPLPHGPEPDATADAADAILWAQALPTLRPDWTRPGLRWALWGLLALGALWPLAAERPPLGLAPKGADRHGFVAAPGPSFEAYARRQEGPALGRPLQEGDPLFADDQLVLGIHNAPAPGVEAAQFAAVFAMDEGHHVAALYPAPAAEAMAMPLPQVASMALLDGPQVTGPQGPITVVAVFLRKQVALDTLMQALVHNAPGDGAPHLEAAPALNGALVRLQRVTLTHRSVAAPSP
jgi:hypothetical protein